MPAKQPSPFGEEPKTDWAKGDPLALHPTMAARTADTLRQLEQAVTMLEVLGCSPTMIHAAVDTALDIDKSERLLRAGR